MTYGHDWCGLNIKIEPVHEISNNVYVRPAKRLTSLHIRAVWSEPLLVAWVLYDY